MQAGMRPVTAAAAAGGALLVVAVALYAWALARLRAVAEARAGAAADGDGGAALRHAGCFCAWYGSSPAAPAPHRVVARVAPAADRARHLPAHRRARRCARLPGASRRAGGDGRAGRLSPRAAAD